MKRGSVVALAVVSLTVALCGVCFSFVGAGGLVQQNTNAITIETISGTWGGGPASDDADASDKKVSGDYGFGCAGSCNNGEKSQNPNPNVDNLIRFRIVRVQESSGTYTVKAITRLSDKSASTDTRDGNGWPGPPKWNATAAVKLSSPAAGANGNPGNQGAGSISHDFSHTANPTQGSWSEALGGKWEDTDSSEMTLGNWVIDVNDPSTCYYWVSATVRTEFSATANEIQVTACTLVATAELEVTSPQ